MTKIQIRCPNCGQRIIDSNAEIGTRVGPEEEGPDWIPDYIQKCPRCKKQIGIQKIYRKVI